MEKRHINILSIVLPMVYFMSYLTRISYSAVLPEMVNAEGITKTAASMALTGSAVSSTGMAVLWENFGWQITVVSWAVIAFLGTALCFLGRKSWEKIKTAS